MSYKTLGITEFYHKIKKHIAFLKGFLEIKNLDFLIQACRLKPVFILQSKNFRYKLSLFDWWIDEFGNSLKISRKDGENKFKIIYDDLDANLIWPKYTSTDLYAGLDVESVAKISSKCYLLIGKDKEKYEDHFIISFLGLDNYLRTFAYQDNKWQLIPTLSLGIRSLSWLALLEKLKNCRETYQKYKILVPCAKQQAWLSYLPVAPEISKIIKENNLGTLEFLTKERH